MSKDNLTLKGEIELSQYRDGELVDHEVITNTISNSGKAEVAGLINEQRSGGFKYLAIGTSATTLTASSNTLGSEVTSVTNLNRTQATASLQTTDVANDTAQLLNTFTNGSSNTVTIQEAGMFDTSTQDTAQMLGGQTFTSKSLENNDNLQVTYKIDID
jgi:hypothetical protein